jgi:predicted DNA-binding transcriptional regulator YafY
VVAEQGESWLLTAYCHERDAILDFSFAGISDAEPTGDFFQRPADFDPEGYFENRFQALRGDGNHVVKIEVESDKAPYFRRKTYHPTQSILDGGEDGSILVRFEVSSLDDIAAFIRSWGPGVWVHTPECLAERIEKEARSVYRGYSEVAD